MSLIKTFFKIIFSIILALSLILSILSLSLYQTTSYKNLEPRVTIYIEQQFSAILQDSTQHEIDYLKTNIVQNCSNKKEINFSLGTDYSDYSGILNSIKIDCSKVYSEMNTEQILQLGSESVFNSLYFKKYDCRFIDCLSQIQQQPDKILVLASKEANLNFKTSTLILLAFTIILMISIILLSKPKFTMFYAFASAFLLSGILFILKFSFNKIINQIQEPISGIFNSFVLSFFINSLVVFILGFIFLILAIIFKTTRKEIKQKIPKKVNLRT